MYNYVDRAVSEFTKQENSDWYHYFGQMIAEWGDFCVHSNKAIQGLNVVKRALKRVQEKPTQYTNIHKTFAFLCYRAHCFQHALPVIDSVHTSIREGYFSKSNKGNTKMKITFQKSKTVNEIIQYNQFRGLIYLALERHEDAYLSFAKALSLPFYSDGMGDPL